MYIEISVEDLKIEWRFYLLQ